MPLAERDSAEPSFLPKVVERTPSIFKLVVILDKLPVSHLQTDCDVNFPRLVSPSDRRASMNLCYLRLIHRAFSTILVSPFRTFP